MEASYDTKLLQRMADQLDELTSKYDIEARVKAVKVVSDAWPLIGMAETPGDYDELCESVEKAAKAVLTMTKTLSEGVHAVAKEYVKQEEEHGKDIESVVTD